MRTNGRDVEDVDGFLASPTQERPPQEEVEELSLMTNQDSRQAEMKKSITPLVFDRGSRPPSARKGTG